MKIKSFLLGFQIVMMAIFAAGCGAKKAAVGAKSFDSAPPQIKQAWDKAWAADKTNDYLAAATGYKALLNSHDALKPEQAQAVQEANGKLLQRLVNAATAGDAAAKQALQSMQPGRKR